MSIGDGIAFAALCVAIAAYNIARMHFKKDDDK